MKKLFTTKNMMVKIALILAIIILIEFTLTARPAQALSSTSIGGTLLEPVLKLTMALGDGAIDIVQKGLIGIDESFVTIDLDSEGVSWFKKSLATLAGLYAVDRKSVV